VAAPSDDARSQDQAQGVARDARPQGSAQEARGSAVSEALRAQAVPLLFLAVTVAGLMLSSRTLGFFERDITERTARNAFIVLSLVIPIVAGLGLNFGIVLGAMSGQVGVIVAEELRLSGHAGLAVAALVSVPISIALGVGVGLCMNRAKGREMVTGLILGFFANGVYQLVFLLLAGPVLPFTNKALLLPQGTGLRNTIELDAIAGSLSRGGVFAWTGALALALVWFQRTKLGQELRAIGQDAHAAQILGIDVDRRRIIAMVISTVLGGVGMVLYLLDTGTLNTFQSHEQVGFYAIAALLVGGAGVDRATVAQALVGTVLFHALVTVLVQVGQEHLGAPQVGEYLRELATYTIIGATLAIHAVKKAREKRLGDMQ